MILQALAWIFVYIVCVYHIVHGHFGQFFTYNLSHSFLSDINIDNMISAAHAA